MYNPLIICYTLQTGKLPSRNSEFSHEKLCFFFHSYVAVYQRVTGKLEFRMIRGYIMCIYS